MPTTHVATPGMSHTKYQRTDLKNKLCMISISYINLTDSARPIMIKKNSNKITNNNLSVEVMADIFIVWLFSLFLNILLHILMLFCKEIILKIKQHALFVLTEWVSQSVSQPNDERHGGLAKQAGMKEVSGSWEHATVHSWLCYQMWVPDFHVTVD